MDDGTTKFKVNRVQSYDLFTQYDSAASKFTVVLSKKESIMDRSIFPWKNTRNNTFLDWQGEIKKLISFNY